MVWDVGERSHEGPELKVSGGAEVAGGGSLHPWSPCGKQARSITGMQRMKSSHVYHTGQAAISSHLSQVCWEVDI